MQTELVRASESLEQPDAWHTHASKQVMVVCPPNIEGHLHLTVGCLAAAAALAVAGTSISYRLPVVELEKVGYPSPTSGPAREEEVQPAVPAMLQAIRKRTALTWEQLAAIFSVSRRAVHHWAGGGSITAEHRHKVRTLLNEVVEFGAVEPFVARSRLLSRHGLAPILDHDARSEPILIADQSPLVSETAIRRNPVTRVRRG